MSTQPNSGQSYTRHIGPTRFWLLSTLNLSLRVFIKWTLRRGVDVARIRKQVRGLERFLGKRLKPLRSIAVDCGGVAAQWIGNEESERVLLYFHGGAFITRSPKTHAAMVARWCEPLSARALLVDYRLAPEHPFPAAVDDCHRAYRWLLAQGYRADQVVIGGDSAGGNLALATLHRIKAAAEPMPACTVLLSPFVDFTLSGESVVANANRDPVFTLAFATAIRACYAPPERFLDPTVSPLFGDFRNLPPLLFQAGSTEMLLDDAVRAAAKAHAAGVSVELEIWDRMPHVFQAFAALPQARAATRSIVRFIHQHTDGSQTAVNSASVIAA